MNTLEVWWCAIRCDDSITGISRKLKCVWQHWSITTEWRTLSGTCAKKGITLKLKKFKFCRGELDFMGYHVDCDLCKPLKSAWQPMDICLSFLATASIIEPFRELLQKPHVGVLGFAVAREITMGKESDIPGSKGWPDFYNEERSTIAITDWARWAYGSSLARDTSGSGPDVFTRCKCYHTLVTTTSCLMMTQRCSKLLLRTQLLIAKVYAGDSHQQYAQEVACLLCEGRVGCLAGSGDIHIWPGNFVMLETVSSGHSQPPCRSSGTQQYVRQGVYWPGLKGDLQYFCGACNNCNTHALSQAVEPLVLTPSPEYSFQYMVADLFQLEGQVYLAYADRCMCWVEIIHLLHSTTSNNIKYFALLGG